MSHDIRARSAGYFRVNALRCGTVGRSITPAPLFGPRRIANRRPHQSRAPPPQATRADSQSAAPSAGPDTAPPPDASTTQAIDSVYGRSVASIDDRSVGEVTRVELLDQRRRTDRGGVTACTGKRHDPNAHGAARVTRTPLRRSSGIVGQFQYRSLSGIEGPTALKPDRDPVASVSRRSGVTRHNVPFHRGRYADDETRDRHLTTSVVASVQLQRLATAQTAGASALILYTGRALHRAGKIPRGRFSEMKRQIQLPRAADTEGGMTALFGRRGTACGAMWYTRARSKESVIDGRSHAGALARMRRRRRSRAIRRPADQERWRR